MLEFLMTTVFGYWALCIAVNVVSVLRERVRTDKQLQEWATKPAQVKDEFDIRIEEIQRKRFNRTKELRRV